MGRARGVNQRASKVCSRGQSRCEDAGGDGGVRRRNLNHPLARDDDAVNNDRHGKQDKTGFISREIPFLPGDRDTTVPATQCNGLCHVTLSHTYSFNAKTAPPRRALQTRSKKVFKRKLKPHATHQSRESTLPNSIQTCNIYTYKNKQLSKILRRSLHAPPCTSWSFFTQSTPMAVGVLRLHQSNALAQ